MADGIRLGRAEARVEVLLRNQGRVTLVTVQLREVPGNPDLKVPPVDESRGVGDDRAEVTLVELVAAKLRLAVVASRDDDRLQADAVLEDVHVRVETQLPAAVEHLLGNDDLETEVDPPVTLRHVAEAGRDDRGVDDLARDHLARGLVPDGLHQDELPSFGVRHADGVAAAGGDGAPLLGHLAAGEGEAGRQLTGPHTLELARCAAPVGEGAKGRRSGKKEGE